MQSTLFVTSFAIRVAIFATNVRFLGALRVRWCADTPSPWGRHYVGLPRRAKVAFGDLSQNCFADQRLGILLRKTINFAPPSPWDRHYVGLPQRAKVAFGDLSQNCFADQRLGILLRKTINFAPPFPKGKGDHVVVDEENPYIAV